MPEIVTVRIKPFSGNVFTPVAIQEAEDGN
jgi:hypothetical protein